MVTVGLVSLVEAMVGLLILALFIGFIVVIVGMFKQK